MFARIITAIFSILVIAGILILGFNILQKTPLKNIVTPHVKFVRDHVCQPTSYKETCIRTLESLETTRPQDFIKATILAASDEIRKTFKYQKSLRFNETETIRSLNSCRELLFHALEVLQQSYVLVDNTELRTVNEGSTKLLTWLSSVLAYQETCVDGFEDDSQMKYMIKIHMIDSSHQVDNALAMLLHILDYFSHIKNVTNSTASPPPRRLLSVDGYTNWVSGSGSSSDRNHLGLEENVLDHFSNNIKNGNDSLTTSTRRSRSPSMDGNPNGISSSDKKILALNENNLNHSTTKKGYISPATSTRRGRDHTMFGNPSEVSNSDHENNLNHSSTTKKDYVSPATSTRRGRSHTMNGNPNGVSTTSGIPSNNDEYPNWVSDSDRKLLSLHENGKIKPDAIVAKDGSGQFRSISSALSAYPENQKGRYIIYVKAGIYRKHIVITRKQKNVFIYGDGPRKTIITGKLSHKRGVTTWKTATFAIEGDGFIAKAIGFSNTASSSEGSAVALRVDSDMSVFYNCRIDGHRNTLFYQAKRQFFRNCIISGTVDFIFGYGTAMIQNSLIIVRKPKINPKQKNIITADGSKEKHATTGLVIHNCRIVPEKKFLPYRFTVPTYLGRPWKRYSRTVVMESQLADFIKPEGWMPMAGILNLNTLYYAEYNNEGPGSRTENRVKWKNLHFINRDEAQKFTVEKFLNGAEWIMRARVPVLLGLRS